MSYSIRNARAGLETPMIMLEGTRNAREGLETLNDYVQRHTKCKGRTWNLQWLCPTTHEMKGKAAALKSPMIMPNGTQNAREGLETLKIHSFGFFSSKNKTGCQRHPSQTRTLSVLLLTRNSLLVLASQLCLVALHWRRFTVGFFPYTVGTGQYHYLISIFPCSMKCQTLAT